MKDLFFILGARDPEMREIARVLRAHEVRYGNAVRGFHPVKAGTAYDADNVVKDRMGRDGPSVPAVIPADARVVFVECSVRGITPAEVCDHHNAGTPGLRLRRASTCPGLHSARCWRCWNSSPRRSNGSSLRRTTVWDMLTKATAQG